METYLHIGGLFAVGFDRTENYLLAVSHSGRGVFSTEDWKRVARDYALAYPKAGIAIGIGPLDNVLIPVFEIRPDVSVAVNSPSGRFILHCEPSGIRIEQPD